MMTWTDERVELLRKLWLEQFSASRIATELGGVSRNAVIGKIHRLGLWGRGQPTRAVKRLRKPPSVRHRVYRPLTIGNTAPKAEPETLVEHEGVCASKAVPIAKKLTLATLTEQTCRWPIGNPRAEDFHFCGHDALEGVPYCRYHTGVAYRAGR